jgi:chromosome segregation ATPase
MFLAKLKTTMVVLVSVTALSLGTGGLVYQQTRAGAADSGSGQKTLGKAVSDAPQQAKQARDEARSLAAAQDQEKALRQELERARQQAEAARQQAQAERERAEAELKKAQAVLRQFEKKLSDVDQQDATTDLNAEKSKRFSSSSGQSPSRSSKVKDKDKDPNRDKKTMDKLDDAQARVRTQFERARQSLQKQLKQLDEQEKKTLDKLAAEKADLQKRQQAPETKPAASGDKLDQILQRLEKLEKRLDRIERRDRDDN